MTAEEGERWFRSAHIGTYRAGRLHLPTPIAAYLLPKDSGAKTALARIIMNEIFAEKPVVMMLGETGVWPSCENGFVFIKYREAITPGQYIGDHAFTHYPLHFAEAHEATSMEGLIDLCLYFIWDATIFDGAGEAVVEISHDEWIEIGSTSVDKYNHAVALFKTFELERI